MSPSRSRSSTEAIAAVAAVAALLLAACADDAPPPIDAPVDAPIDAPIDTASVCGPGGAAPDGITATIDGKEARYQMFTSSVNNDCTIGGSGVISITIQGVQQGQASTIALCLPRPDLLGAEPSPLAPSRVPPDPADRVQLFDVSAMIGSASGCTVMLVPGSTPTGTARFDGYCEGGTHPAGYALTLAGSADVTVTCPGGQPNRTTATLAGTAAVVAE